MNHKPCVGGAEFLTTTGQDRYRRRHTAAGGYQCDVVQGHVQVVDRGGHDITASPLRTKIETMWVTGQGLQEL